jgi:acyl dehydratase
MVSRPTVRDPNRLVLSERPDLKRLFLRAAVTSRGRGGDLPPTRVELADQAVDVTHLARYARVCGFALSDTLPATYLHVLAFPLQVELMAGRSFPLPLAGMVHVANEIRVSRAVQASERVDLVVWSQDLREHPKGALVDLHGQARVAGEVVWHGRSTYLARGHQAPPGGSTLPADDLARTAAPEVPDRASSVVRVPDDIGRRYASVSGDVNPIHLNPLAAKAFGFPRAIAHGMWTHARSLAALEGRLPAGAVEVQAEFAKPVLLPTTVALHTALTDDGAVVEMRPGRRPGLHVRTTVSGASA